MYNNPNKIKEDRFRGTNKEPPSNNSNSNAPVFILNKNGEFIAVNNAFCQIIGRPENEILGINIGDARFLTQSARKKARYRNVSRLMGKEVPVYTLDVIIKNGDILLLEIDTKPHVKDEKIAGEIGIVKKTKKINPLMEKKETNEQEDFEGDKSNLLTLYELIQDKNKEIKRLHSKIKEASSELDLQKKRIDEKTDQWRSFQSW
jgi:PAS domain S-box-containing protein